MIYLSKFWFNHHFYFDGNFKLLEVLKTNKKYKIETEKKIIIVKEAKISVFFSDRTFF